MITNVRTITVQVSDQDRAIGFYVDQLGFDKTRDIPMGPDERWIEVAPPNGGTTLVLSRAQETKGAFTGYIFDTDNMHQTYETLNARGVNFTVPPRSEPWGEWAQFADLDGNEFGIWAPPEGAQGA
jgi:lactoylglutathione lyase